MLTIGQTEGSYVSFKRVGGGSIHYDVYRQKKGLPWYGWLALGLIVWGLLLPSEKKATTVASPQNGQAVSPAAR
jgi:hypothetical protein